MKKSIKLLSIVTIIAGLLSQRRRYDIGNIHFIDFLIMGKSMEHLKAGTKIVSLNGIESTLR